MEKQEIKKTPSERVKALKRKKRTLFASEIGSCTAPFVILSIVNFKDYFVKTEAWRTSLAFSLLLGSTLIVVLLVAKKQIKLNLSSVLVGLGIVDVFCFVLGKLINELAYILLYVIIGVAVAVFIDYKRKGEDEELEKLLKGIEKAETDQIAEEYKEELTTKVKIKIKK